MFENREKRQEGPSPGTQGENGDKNKSIDLSKEQIKDSGGEREKFLEQQKQQEPEKKAKEGL